MKHKAPTPIIEMRQVLPDASEVHERVLRALERFTNQEDSLIRLNPSERSLTHRFAICLETEFPKWHVDCEYNRLGEAAKKLKGLVPNLTNTDNDEPPTVFPDIVIHRRGPDGPNLLVIEAKKATSRVSAEMDRLKLRCFLTELQYRFGAFIVLPAGNSNGAPPEWFLGDG